MKVSLIISTYNWKEALNLCLKSVKNQTVLPDEIIVADDGSRSDTKELIDAFRNQIPVPVIHVWHEDTGFHLASIRNKAFAKAQFEYVVQIDGDLILHPYFIADHISFAKEGSFVTGSRSKIREDLSCRLMKEGNIDVSVFMKGTSNFINGLHLPFLSRFSEKRKANDIFAARGCNMAFWRKDLLAVNGYNEDFEGWGREDTELVYRLMNIGLEKRFIKFRGIVFHIHHAERTQSDKLDQNDRLLADSVKRMLKRCDRGIDLYL